MARLLIINNIPTPYRLHMFSAIDRAMQPLGLSLEVWFMAASEMGRYWKQNLQECPFSARIVPGVHPYYGGLTMHINPQMWLDILHRPPTWFLVGGGWHLPTSVGLQFLHHPQSYRLVWAEANYVSARFHSGIPARYRTMALRSADAVVIPGEIARKTLEDHWHIRPKQLLYLPNLVDEAVFRDRIGELRQNRVSLRAAHQLPLDRRVLFWSAQLVDEYKGILNFLEAVGDLPVTILLAGGGKDRPLVQKWADEHQNFDLRLLGHLPQENLIEYMAVADVAILPSLKDSSPLTMVEAIWAGLPVLTSVNCGNWPETVQPGINGWLVNPADTATLRGAVREILDCSEDDLSQMGQQSTKIAKENFDTATAVSRFVDLLLKELPPRVS